MNKECENSELKRKQQKKSSIEITIFIELHYSSYHFNFNCFHKTIHNIHKATIARLNITLILL
jgi:hypothetical protein